MAMNGGISAKSTTPFMSTSPLSAVISSVNTRSSDVTSQYPSPTSGNETKSSVAIETRKKYSPGSTVTFTRNEPVSLSRALGGSPKLFPFQAMSSDRAMTVPDPSTSSSTESKIANPGMRGAVNTWADKVVSTVVLNLNTSTSVVESRSPSIKLISSPDDSPIEKTRSVAVPNEPPASPPSAPAPGPPSKVEMTGLSTRAAPP